MGINRVFQKVTQSNTYFICRTRSKKLVFSEEIRGTNKIYFDRVISQIKSQGVTILVVMLDGQQDSILVTRALKEGLLYPQYT